MNTTNSGFYNLISDSKTAKSCFLDKTLSNSEAHRNDKDNINDENINIAFSLYLEKKFGITPTPPINNEIIDTDILKLEKYFSDINPILAIAMKTVFTKFKSIEENMRLFGCVSIDPISNERNYEYYRPFINRFIAYENNYLYIGIHIDRSKLFFTDLPYWYGGIEEREGKQGKCVGHHLYDTTHFVEIKIPEYNLIEFDKIADKIIDTINTGKLYIKFPNVDGSLTSSNKNDTYESQYSLKVVAVDKACSDNFEYKLEMIRAKNNLQAQYIRAQANEVYNFASYSNHSDSNYFKSFIAKLKESGIFFNLEL